MVKTIDECFFQIQNGANIKQGDVDDGFPITRIETTANDKFNRDRMGYAGITDISKYESYVLEDGDLLMSHINSVQYLGRTVLYVKEADETIIHGMNLLRLKARRNIIDPSYARYCFYGHSFRSKISNITKKSVNQASFAVKDLKQIKIEVPSLSEQDQIVKILDGIQNLIQMRNDELSVLDDLIKARFVEMFGLVRNNVYGYKIKMLQDVCEPIKDGTHQTPTYVNDAQHGFKFLSSKDVTSGKINWSKIKYIPSDLHEELYAKIKPKRGDILLAKNGTTGVAAVVETDEIFDIYVSLALLRPIDMNSIYLWAAVNSADTKHQFDSSLKGIGVPNLHLGEIKKTKIIVPPLELQNQFADFVHQVDKSKAAVQKALDETQLLFDSLMQKYFK